MSTNDNNYKNVVTPNNGFYANPERQLNADRVLLGALSELKTVMVVGYEPSGELYVSTNGGKLNELVGLLEISKNFIIRNHG